jgi:hypothetical protein
VLRVGRRAIRYSQVPFTPPRIAQLARLAKCIGLDRFPLGLQLVELRGKLLFRSKGPHSVRLRVSIDKGSREILRANVRHRFLQRLILLEGGTSARAKTVT